MWGIAVLKARGLALGITICQLKWTCPVMESHLDQQLELKESRIETGRGIYQQLLEIMQKTVSSK